MKNDKMEFLRKTPLKKNGFVFTVLHKVIPFLICLVSLWYATQVTAQMLEYNEKYLGKPFIVIDDYPIYPPYMLLVVLFGHVAKGDLYVQDVVAETTKIATKGFFIGVIVYFILVWTRGAKNKKDEKVFGSARWGNKKDLRKAGLCENQGVVLGQQQTAKIKARYINGSINLQIKKIAPLVQYDAPVSAILFGPSRAGKGTTSVVTTLLDFPGSIITIDPKGENYNITAGWRSKFSHVFRTGPCSKDNNALNFNILEEIDEHYAYRDANMIAEILTTPSDGKVDGSQKHWIDTARGLITGVILHVLCSSYKDKNLGGVRDFLSSGSGNATDTREILTEMINSPHCRTDIHKQVTGIANQNLQRPDEELGSVFSSATTALDIFLDPYIREASNFSDFCLKDFQTSDAPISWYLTVPFSDLDRIAPYLRLIITFILRKFSQGETQFGEVALKNRILFLIDEFATLGTIQTIETMMGILNGYGMSFFLICQSKTQIDKLYGEKNPMLDHCKYVVTYAMNDLPSAEYFSKMAGIEGIEKSSTSSSGNRFDLGMNNLNVSNDVTQRNLINADEVQHLPPEYALLFAQGSPATLIKKLAYYSDKRFMHKINLPKPETREDFLGECAHTVKKNSDEKQWYDVEDEEDFPFAEMYIPENTEDLIDADESSEQRGFSL